jgi:predicted transcriptional regulator
MDRLWLWNRPASVREVMEDLQRTRSIAYTTVMSTMDNLHRKGVLTREQEGRAYLYQPVLSREDYNATLMAQVLDQSADRTATLLRFVEKITPGELSRLRKLLNESRRKDTSP